MTLVVDASVACKWFIEEEGSAKAARLLESEESFVAPDLIIPEVSNAFWRKLQAGQMTSEQAALAVEQLPGFFDDLVPGVLLAARSIAIAAALDHPVYDCFYIALAELKATRLVTADLELVGRLAKTRWARCVVRM